MIQVLFFGLLIVSFMAGYFVYVAPSQKPIDPVRFMMDSSGYSTEETLNRKKNELINMTMTRGVMQIRSRIDDLAVEQDRLLDSIRDQEQLLKNASKDVNNVLFEAERRGNRNDKDILQLKALTSEMQDQQRLLVTHGQELISLNDQLSKNRQSIAEQMDLANINNESSLNTLQQRYDTLKDQADSFFDKVSKHNQEIRDQIDKMQYAQVQSNKDIVRQQSIKDRIVRMQFLQHENMVRLADCEERNRNLMQDAQQRIADSEEHAKDAEERTQELVEDERQKQEDQEAMLQQRIADQKQRLQDQEAINNPNN